MFEISMETLTGPPGTAIGFYQQVPPKSQTMDATEGHFPVVSSSKYRRPLYFGR
jgi:hypothetical protein